ncbi:MAG: hypothetical protein H0T60_15585 [Acidobacteria bacterium]|nr:hypothetical protein [Acidobacteriota bacterium]
MSDAITDTNDQPLLYVNLRLGEGADSVVIIGRVPCRAGRFLATDSDTRAQVLARRTGSGNAFVDIADAPIDLTEFDGETVEFDFKVSAGEVTGLERVALPVRVTYQI